MKGRVVSTGEPSQETLARIGTVVLAAVARLEAKQQAVTSEPPEPDA